MIYTESRVIENGAIIQNARPTFLYVIYNPITKLYKIGIAVDYLKRITSLALFCGCKLQIVDIFNIKGARQAEAELHRYFKDNRIMGEWFTDIDLSYIREEYTPIRKIQSNKYVSVLQ